VIFVRKIFHPILKIIQSNNPNPKSKLPLKKENIIKEKKTDSITEPVPAISAL